MATAICAWRRRQGIAVAPFQAQNMSNNSYPCRGGGLIGRPRGVPAEAVGRQPQPATNPSPRKPGGAGRSQVIANARLWKTLSPRRYYDCADELRPYVRAAYEELSRRFDVVVIEG